MANPSSVEIPAGADQATQIPATEQGHRASRLGVVEAKVRRRQERCFKAITPLEPVWDEALHFLDGDQYVERNAVNGALDRVETRNGSLGKPRWRPRNTRNRFTAAILGVASTWTSRVPSYEVVPTSGDPKAVAAAQMGDRVLVSLHQTLNLPRWLNRLAVYAATTGAGYLWPYWNSEVGTPLYAGGTEEAIGYTGEIDKHILQPSEVGWDPGADFDSSRYHFVRQAESIETLKDRYDYIGPKDLSSDAVSKPLAGDAVDDLVFVYHYLERPCREHPKGRWLQYAQDRLIAAPRDYPRSCDKPCILELPWFERDHRHRPMGLGQDLVDPQRTINRTVSQIILWKNLALAPQVMAPENSILTPITDEPGAVFYYRLQGQMKPEWRPTMEIPSSLFETIDRAIADMEEITGLRDIPPGVESGTAIVALNERDASRRGMTTRTLATFYSQLGLFLLELVRHNYTEQRLMVLQGRLGTDLIEGFMGEQIGDPATVLVQEASVEPRTRAAQEAKIMSYADRQWIDPHQAMTAINAGTADTLIDSVELNVSKQWREIQHMITAGTTPPSKFVARYQDQVAPDAIPAPLPQDDDAVHMDVIDQYMLTRDYEQQPEQVREFLMLHRQSHEEMIQLEQQQQMAAQSAQAEQQGQTNATRPAAEKPSPSQPSLGAHAAGANGLPNGSG